MIECVVSVGSVWLMDTVGGRGRYMRLPLAEAPRERPEWGDARAGACEDGRWFGVRGWWRCDDDRRMVIAPTDWLPFWVPLTRDVMDTDFDTWAELVNDEDLWAELIAAVRAHALRA